MGLELDLDSIRTTWGDYNNFGQSADNLSEWRKRIVWCVE